MKDVLDEQQRRAVEAGEGPILIIAGPGTGKTKTLSCRIAYLIKNKLSPKQILALTFTNKAAREMQERLKTLFPARQTHPNITTFHGFCYQTLTDLAGEKPSLITESERQLLLSNLKKEHKLKGLSVRELSLRISRLKSQLETHDAQNDMGTLTQQYQAILSERGLYDFDDLLLQTVRLFTQQPDKKPVYQHILVDEFQDTNQLQYKLLKLLNTTDNLFAIGDPQQSIYGFRGGSSDIFAQCKQDWPKVSSIDLLTNYRSVPQLVTLGNAIFPKAPQLQAHRQGSGHAQAVQVLNVYSEAQWIIETIEQKIGGSTMIAGHKYHHQDRQHAFQDFAVLYRTHHASKALRKKLDESGIPYQVAGEGSPYQKPEAAAIVASLQYLAGSQDLPEKVFQLSSTQIKTLLEPLRQGSENQNVSTLAMRIAEVFQFDITQAWIQQFLGGMVRFDDQGLEFYLAHIQAIAEQEFYDPLANAITLLTIHAAKGLEFNHVFLIAAEDGILPHHTPNKRPNIEEEHRLFYVAVTRARNHLDILYAKNRAGKPVTPSSFVTDISSSLLPRIVDPNMSTQQKRIRKYVLKRSQTSLF